jgi:hypothetical protein
MSSSETIYSMSYCHSLDLQDEDKPIESSLDTLVNSDNQDSINNLFLCSLKKSIWEKPGTHVNCQKESCFVGHESSRTFLLLNEANQQISQLLGNQSYKKTANVKMTFKYC